MPPTSTVPRRRPSARARPPVDPRLRARRIEVRRDEGRRRLRRLVALAVLVAVAAVVFAVTRSPLLSVHTVKVRGANHTSPVAVRRAAGIAPGTPMFDVASGQVASRLDALPWVASASVHRRWPRTVEIHVTERRPAGRIADGSGWLVVDATGRVLERRPSPSADLVRIDWTGARAAPGATVAVPRDLLRLAGAIPAALRPAVAEVGRRGASMQIHLRSGAVVQVGDGTALRDKLVSVMTLVAGPDARCAAVIDVQVPAAPTLTTQKGCA